jgi:hypothetical protein
MILQLHELDVAFNSLHQFSDFILLHGMEDTHKKFSSLFEIIELSQTTTLVVFGPIFFSKRIG